MPSGGFERFLSDLSARFVALRSDQVDEAITPALREVCEYLATDRATFIEFEEGDERAAVCPHSWARTGYQPMPRNYRVTKLAWYFDRLARGEDVVLCRLPDDLPAHAVDEVEFV